MRAGTTPARSGTDLEAGGGAGACRAPGRPRDERASQAITEAALRQLDQLGYARMSMESVAVEAGVSRATVYRRYRDKGDLVTAAIAANGGAGPPAGATGCLREDLARYLREFDERFAESCLEVLGALVGAREDPGALSLHRARVIAPRTAYARSLLDEARRRGELRADADIDLALQMAAGSVFYRRVAGITSGDEWATRAVDAIWAAMGPGTA
jgi:AcrR family transcriptional regulator